MRELWTGLTVVGIDHEAEKFGGNTYYSSRNYLAATTTFTCGMSWESSAYTLYTRIPPSVLCLVTRPLAEE